MEETVFFANLKEQKADMESYEKLKSIVNEDIRQEQSYMNMKGIGRGRMAFRIRTRMVKKVKMNFKGLFKDNLKCEKCELEQDETQEHLMVCPGWAEERGSLDVTGMDDRVEFFTRVCKKKE